MAEFDGAQICGNGHLVTGHLKAQPGTGENICPICQAPTLAECPHCHRPIRGYQIGGEGEEYEVPTHCYHCGAAYPWTKIGK
jgi:hypothetical protein